LKEKQYHPVDDAETSLPVEDAISVGNNEVGAISPVGSIVPETESISVGNTVAKVVPVEGEAISPLGSVVVIKPVVGVAIIPVVVLIPVRLSCWSSFLVRDDKVVFPMARETNNTRRGTRNRINISRWGAHIRDRNTTRRGHAYPASE
jgi:hypothetical protein